VPGDGFCFAGSSPAWQHRRVVFELTLKSAIPPHRFQSDGPGAARGFTVAAAVMLACIPGARANEPVAPLVIPSVVQDGVVPAEGGEDDVELGFQGAPAATDPETGVAPVVEAPVIPEGLSGDAAGLMIPDPLSEGVFEEEDVVDTAEEEEDDRTGLSVADDFTFVPGASTGGLPSLNDPWLSGFDGMGLDGIAGGPFFMGGGPTSLRRGLAMSLSLTGIYDTNPSRGFSGADAGSDFFMLLGGGVAYQSTAATWTYGASYSGGYRMYFDQTDLNGDYHNAGASVNYAGAKLRAGYSLGVNYGSGANRNFQSVTETLRFSNRINARYEVSRKTSLQADVSQSLQTSSGGGNQDTSSFDAGLSGLWKYSQLTEFGPGIRYTRRSQGSGPTRDTIGPTMTLNYRLSRKVSFNAKVGVDFVSLEGAGSQDPSLFTSIGATYRPSELWNMNLALVRDNRASYNVAGQFEEVTAVRLNYYRRISRLNWNTGLSWESTSVSNDAPGGSNRDRDYFSIDTSLGMAIFRSTTQATVFCGYRDETQGNRSWDSFQVGFGLTRNF